MVKPRSWSQAVPQWSTQVQLVEGNSGAGDLVLSGNILDSRSSEDKRDHVRVNI